MTQHCCRIITRHTERSGVWKGMLIAVFFAVSCYRYLGDGGTDRREILHGDRPTYVSRVCILPFWAVPPGIPQKSKCWPSKTANISKTVSQSAKNRPAIWWMNRNICETASFQFALRFVVSNFTIYSGFVQNPDARLCRLDSEVWRRRCSHTH